MVKNPTANAGDTGLIPALGRSHMPGSNTAHAPQLLKPARSLTRETTAIRSQSATTQTPLTTTRESPGTATKTRHNQKCKINQSILKKKKRVKLSSGTGKAGGGDDLERS